MSTMSHLIEYLIAAQRPGGGHLVKFGGQSVQVPVFPAGLSVSATYAPDDTAYAIILYYQRFSPVLVPNAFEIATSHSGMQVSVGALDSTMISEGHNLWIVSTHPESLLATWTNVSGINQFFEIEHAFIIVESREDMHIVDDIIRDWGSSSRMVSIQEQTNRLLEQLVVAQGGTTLLPRPPADIGRVG